MQNDSKSKKNEIFVDILERISVLHSDSALPRLSPKAQVLMSSNGFVINSAIDGSIQMKFEP